MNPMFSIIVPIYKVEKYLIKCIESIVNQKFKNYELILVDDGSTDGCPKICDEYSKLDSRIKVIHKENGGLVSARKAGCEIATGQYIVNVDGDDWITDECLNVLQEVVIKYNPDIICFGAIYSGKKEKYHYINSREGYYKKSDIQREIFPILIESKNGTYFPPSIWSKVFKRKLYEKYQKSVDNRISIGEDNACTKPIIYKANDMYIIKECLYYYRLNEDSMTRTKKAYNLIGPKLISQHFENNIDMKEYDFQIQVYRALVHNLFNAVVSQFNRNDDKLDIKNEIIEVLEDEYNKTAITRCKYSICYLKGNLAKITLKYKMIWIMKFFNKVRQ